MPRLTYAFNFYIFYFVPVYYAYFIRHNLKEGTRESIVAKKNFLLLLDDSHFPDVCLAGGVRIWVVKRVHFPSVPWNLDHVIFSILQDIPEFVQVWSPGKTAADSHNRDGVGIIHAEAEVQKDNLRIAGKKRRLRFQSVFDG